MRVLVGVEEEGKRVGADDGDLVGDRVGGHVYFVGRLVGWREGRIVG